VRVVYVTSTMPFGKKEAFVIPEVRELRRQGHEVLIVPAFPRGKVLHGDVAPLMQSVVAQPLVSPSVLAGAARKVADSPARVAKSLGWMLRSRSLGVLARNLSIYPKGLWLARVARRWRADHIHAHWATVPATMALTASSLSAIPWSVTAHRFDIAEDNLLALKVREACFVRAINNRGAQEIVGIAGPKAPSPVVIHMGVDLDPVGAELAKNAPYNTAGGESRVVIAANLIEVKGHATLLEAVALLAGRGVKLQVDLAGDGPLRAKLADDAQRLGVADRASFLGMLPHEKLLARLRAGEWGMLVLPSIVTASGEKEGIPVALIEAMGYGVPVVSTTTGGITELFDGISDPPLVPPEDAQALAGAMERMVSDPSWRERLVREGRARVEESFAMEQVAAELARRFAGCSPSRPTAT
jgi:glycosyltransferase involved in cell wall biosynthesis